ncbi:vegetative incompatibility protein het-e-1 [Colletotrichum kahawae]|uniref:Vegetative incompatibility protein het-e-1 n=1 Tax=Colletotrichum kahawae TaxID=34407 RepID=A0AAD9YDV0_COLKA|nr:vegetative incompatibility protein het-e-1 [Colletotrichum kahawae]
MDKLETFPPGLDALFERMLKDTSGSESDDALCREILATAAVLYRPVSLDEMKTLVEPEEDFSPGDFADLVRSCGSFLSIRDGFVRFLHQSAKEYLCDKTFWEDASRFLTSFGSIIQEAPMQAYGGALAFCPTSNSIRKKFWDQRVEFLKDSRGINKKESLLQVLQGHSGTVTAVAFSPDGKVLASCSSYANVIMLWHTFTGELWRALEGHTSPVRTAVFSPDGEMVASGSEDGTIKLWNTTSGELTQTLHSSSEIVGRITALAFSQDHNSIASASDSNKTNSYSITFWNIETGDARVILRGPSNPQYQATFSPDGKWAVLVLRDENAENDIVIRLLDMETPVAFSPAGKVVAAGSGNGHVRLWDTTLETSRIRPYEDRVNSVDVSPNGKLVASTSSDTTVRLWNVATGLCETTLEGHTDRITTAVFSPDGELIASASCDNTIRLWDVRTRICRKHDGSRLPNTYGFWTFPFHENGEDWIKKNGERMLKPPEEYRANCLAMQGNMLVQGHRNGKVTFLDLNSSSEE